jgi:hypothetical protein
VASTIEGQDPKALAERWFERVEQHLAVADSSVEHQNGVAGSSGVREPRSTTADVGVSARPPLC